VEIYDFLVPGKGAARTVNGRSRQSNVPYDEPERLAGPRPTLLLLYLPQVLLRSLLIRTRTMKRKREMMEMMIEIRRVRSVPALNLLADLLLRSVRVSR
jgi:hypothetical protein